MTRNKKGNGDTGPPADQAAEESALWEALGELAPPTPDSEIPRAEALIAQWSAASEVRRSTRRRRVRPLVAAAAALTLFAGGWSASRMMPATGGEMIDSGFAEVATESALATLRLSDGTLVRVAPGSRMRFTQTNESREVWLDGRAFFAIASDPDRPFRVRSPGGEAEALGTRFDYESEGDEVRLIVVDGRVALSSGDQQVEVAAGEMRDVRAAQISEATQVADVYGALAWMGRSLVFQATPLDVVARELSSRFGIPIRLTDTALAERTVTSWFADQEFEEVFTAICRAVNTECSHSSEGAVMAPRTMGGGH